MTNPQIYASASWHTVTSAKIYIGAGWRVRTRRMLYKGGVWKQVARYLSPISATADPTSAFGSVSSSGVATVYSSSVTIMPTGGLAPYTYTWSAPGFIISNSGNATTYFSANVAPFGEFSGTATCTVSDTLGDPVATVTVPIDLNNYGSSGRGF
jgi:hypothetical protein